MGLVNFFTKTAADIPQALLKQFNGPTGIPDEELFKKLQKQNFGKPQEIYRAIDEATPGMDMSSWYPWGRDPTGNPTGNPYGITRDDYPHTSFSEYAPSNANFSKYFEQRFTPPDIMQGAKSYGDHWGGKSLFHLRGDETPEALRIFEVQSDPTNARTKKIASNALTLLGRDMSEKVLDRSTGNQVIALLRGDVSKDDLLKQFPAEEVEKWAAMSTQYKQKARETFPDETPPILGEGKVNWMRDAVNQALAEGYTKDKQFVDFLIEPGEDTALAHMREAGTSSVQGRYNSDLLSTLQTQIDKLNNRLPEGAQKAEIIKDVEPVSEFIPLDEEGSIYKHLEKFAKSQGPDSPHYASMWEAAYNDIMSRPYSITPEDVNMTAQEVKEFPGQFRQALKEYATGFADEIMDTLDFSSLSKAAQKNLAEDLNKTVYTGDKYARVKLPAGLGAAALTFPAFAKPTEKVDIDAELAKSQGKRDQQYALEQAMRNYSGMDPNQSQLLQGLLKEQMNTGPSVAGNIAERIGSNSLLDFLLGGTRGLTKQRGYNLPPSQRQIVEALLDFVP